MTTVQIQKKIKSLRSNGLAVFLYWMTDGKHNDELTARRFGLEPEKFARWKKKYFPVPELTGKTKRH